jgi:hypothetical protein
MTKEEWKDIPGYKGIYKISNLGLVVAHAKTWNSGRWITRSHPEKLMAQSVDHKGYYKVGLRKDGKQKMWAVHRLVAFTFIENPENKPQVNHKDTNKKNNKVGNLEWATGAENMQHAHDSGVMNLRIGAKHPRAKLKEEDVIAIRNSNLSDYDLAKHYEMSRSALREARIGKTWRDINSKLIEQQSKEQ